MRQATSFGKQVRLQIQNFEVRGVRQERHTSSGRQVKARSEGPGDAENLRGKQAAVSRSAKLS